MLGVLVLCKQKCLSRRLKAASVEFGLLLMQPLINNGNDTDNDNDHDQTADCFSILEIFHPSKTVL